MKWHEIKIKTVSEHVEIVANILYDAGVGGVVIEDPNDINLFDRDESSWDYFDEEILNFEYEGVIVKGYLPDSEDLHDKIKFIKESVHKLADDLQNKEDEIVTVADVYEEDWANAWKQYYKPKKIGEKIVVKPTWEEYEAKEGEKVIELDPGMAFGTGTHETTMMCIKALEKYVKNDSTVYDIGCGSGILSIAAAKLGAKKVIGVDLDEVAVKVSKENVYVNSVENVVDIRHGNLMEVVEERADIIVANIIAEVIKILVKDIKKFMKEDSVFIASGIILDKIDEVKRELEANGLEIISIERQGEWAAILSKAKVGDKNE
ncbi:50S ribosomal protein L11 methyltransferase [Caminicella sporogenes]|uniref:50S ribosomal protein L11 methyltransferase n=1 Tax=Caminicella sporogenes TaxID=166485 RepID=UPI00254117D7|nr:50S ribosomal protein L11 methyltransferase [Caminicella sporogenes]WIF94806.1 50S ribosomal protein L11 methyltransferase [Caminicella sporogenes]